ncbi:sodium:proton antiporter [Campylobacter geochelonis]|uniref:Na+/H+ antiporter n=1 Tax=Campylobacter geochelonis TaxID=1780362 RepID=A0A128EKI1_9BACT|nr:sodium:proton antiporter [Campylobacter geochelonis]QKF70897.1 putative phosphoribosyltransferase [Campylobacter geochelonis]CZE47937.1 Na+/H+ antiporter [Campylobacter geochelonis]CZE48912.1 Na+/H+ antiporter [Campylobacter geochelonis]CZE51391.1 Na+/H+ antiporter [Campylobacter geochelonis]
MITPRQKLSFKDRLDAAQMLYDVLPLDDIMQKKPLLVCSSLDSVVLVDYIARKLKLSYELLFTENIVSPINPDCIIAMVSETEEIVVIDELVKSFGINLDYVYGESSRKYEEKILKNVYKYRKGELIGSFEGKNILLMDEGCETGITALTCLKSIISLNAKSVSYATPLIASDVVQNLSIVTDQIYTVHSIANFVEVDFYYDDKTKANSQKIISILEESPYYLPLQKEGDKETCSIQ